MQPCSRFCLSEASDPENTRERLSLTSVPFSVTSLCSSKLEGVHAPYSSSAMACIAADSLPCPAPLRRSATENSIIVWKAMAWHASQRRCVRRARSTSFRTEASM